MKKPRFNRNLIIRAIRAACYALFLGAISQKVSAQTVTAPFNQTSGTTYTTTTPYAGPGTFYDPYGVYSITVNAGTLITNTTASNGGGGNFTQATTDIATGGGPFVNHGSIVQTLSGILNSDNAAIALYGDAGGADAVLTNTGIITGSALGIGISTAAVNFDNSDVGEDDTGSVSFSTTNSGTITGTTNDGDAFGIHATSVGTGDITISNLGAGTISASSGGNTGNGIYAYANGGGNITVDNSGTLSATGIGNDTGLAAITTTGNITVENGPTTGGTTTGYSTGSSAAGIYASTMQGAISINSSNAISATATSEDGATGVYAHETSQSVNGALGVTLTGGITVAGDGNSLGIDAMTYVNDISISESGAISVITTTGNATGVSANTSESLSSVTIGNLTVNAPGDATGVEISGTPVTVVNNGAMNVVGGGTVFGINAQNNGGLDTTITGATGSSIYVNSNGGASTAIYHNIGEDASANFKMTNSGTITAMGENSAIGLSITTGSGYISIATNPGADGAVTATSSNGYAIGEMLQTSGGNITVSTGTGGDGTISATGSDTATGFIANAGTGSISFTTPDSISASGQVDSTAVSATTTTGDITFIQSGSGTISSSTTDDLALGIIATTQSGAVTINAPNGMNVSNLLNNATGVFVSSTGSGTTGDIGITLNGAQSVSGQNTSYGVEATAAGSGNVTVTDNGALTVATPYGTANGIVAGSNTGTAALTTNNTVSVSSNYAYAVGLSATGATTSITVNNSLTVSAYYFATGIRLTNSGSGNAVITTSTGDPVQVTSTAQGALGIYAHQNGSGSLDITSNAALTVDGMSTTGDGISAQTTSGNLTIAEGGNVSVTAGTGGTAIFAETNSGAISITGAGTTTISGDYGTVGVYAISDAEEAPAGAITINLTGAISATSSSTYVANLASGILAVSNVADINITSSGGVLSSSGYGASNGIEAMTSTGAVSITSSDSISAAATTISSAYALHVASSGTGAGAILVNNSATLSATARVAADGILVRANSADVTVNSTGNTITVVSSGSSSNAYGIKATSGSGTVMVTNSAAITGTANSGYATGIDAEVGNGNATTNVTVVNSGNITASGKYSNGIRAGNDGTGSTYVTNNTGATVSVTGSSYGSSAIFSESGISALNSVVNHGTLVANNTASAYYSYGINLYQGNAVVTNTGSVTSSSSYRAAGLNGFLNGDITVNNSGTITANGSADSEGIDLFTQGTASTTGGTVQLTNSGKIAASSSAYTASGAYVGSNAGPVTVGNSGLITASGSYSTYGIDAESHGGDATVAVTNTGEIDASLSTSGGTYTLSGIYTVSTGNISVANTHTGSNTYSSGYGSGVIMVTSGSSYGMAQGVYADAAGAATINNSGAITVMASEYAVGIGIGATSVGDLTITNSTNGTITTTSGYQTSDTASAIGINAIVTGAGNIAVTNNGTISTYQVAPDHGDPGTFSGIYAHNVGTTGNTTIANNGTITTLSDHGGTSYGIHAVSTSSGAVTITAGAASSITASSSYTYIAANSYGISLNSSGTAIVSAASGSTITASAGDGTAYGISSNSSYGTAITSGATISASGSGAYGIRAFDGNAVSVTNSGDITATGTTGSTYGIVTGSEYAAVSLTNSGTVMASSNGALVYGISGVGDTDTTIINSGMVTANNGGDGGEADGIIIRSIPDDATVTNSGSASATSTTGAATGILVYVGDNISVTNTVSGTVSATSTDGGTAIGIGSESSGGTSVSVLNAGGVMATSPLGEAVGAIAEINGNGMITMTNSASGTIQAMASSEAIGTVSALYAGTVTFMNAGAITATSSGDTAIGELLEGGNASFAINNSGTITANASVGEADGLNGGTGGSITITNTGTLSATSGADAPANAISLGCGGDLTVTNSGMMNVSGTGASAGITEGNGGNFIFTGTGGSITVIGSSANGIDAHPGGTATLTNATPITVTSGVGGGAGVNVGSGGALIMTNSAQVQSTSSGSYAFGLFLEGNGVSLTNSATVVAQGVGSLGVLEQVDGSAGDVLLNNTGHITATSSAPSFGVNLEEVDGATGTITLTNGHTGGISGTSTSATDTAYGVYIEGGTGGAMVTNNGAISGTNDDGGDVYGVSSDATGAVAVTNSGAITATGTVTVVAIDLTGDDGVAFTNNTGGVVTATGPAGTTTGVLINDTAGLDETITNNGRVNSSGAGIIDLSAGDITYNTTRGTIISGNGHAFTLGTGSNTANIMGNSRITGLMDGGATHVDNTLAFSEIVVTRPQDANFMTVSGEAAADPTGNYTVMLGPETYNFTDFNFVTGDLSVTSFAGHVDSGLEQLAERLDASANVPAGLLPVYVAGSVNPEAALNSFTAREYINAYGTIGLGDDAAFNELTDSRAFAIRSGVTGLDLSGLTVESGSMIASLGDTANTLGQLSMSRVSGTEVVSDSKNVSSVCDDNGRRWGAWVAGTVSFQDESDKYDSPGYKATTGAPTLGADYKLTPDLAVGGLVHLWTTGANFGDGSRLGVETAFLGGYGTYSHDHWYANGLVGAGYSNYDNQRVTLNGLTANSRPTGNKIIANFSGGYDFTYAGYHISPIIGVQYDHIGVGSYTENGADALDLSVANENIDSLRSKVGFHMSKDFNWMGCTFTPDLNASWYHEFLNTTTGVTESTASDPTLGEFVVDTVKPDDDFAMVGVGLSATPAQLHHDVTIFTNYNAQASRSYLSHTVDAGIRIGF